MKNVHIALTVVNGIDFLLTWNCTHIANALLRRTIEVTCRAHGYEMPMQGMISLKAVRLIVKHFDAIYKLVARRLMRPCPWGEPALTSLLRDLLDSQTQEEERPLPVSAKLCGLQEAREVLYRQ